MRLARNHATIHLNRPFLLRSADESQQQQQQHFAQKAVADCLAAAREVLDMVDSMAQDGTLFYAFWWTHYAAFCSLTVVYVWEIQRARTSRSTRSTFVLQYDPNPTLPTLFQMAETCLGHLATATARNSPSRRYSIILEELRQEALACHQQQPQQQTVLFARVPADPMAAGDLSINVGTADTLATTHENQTTYHTGNNTTNGTMAQNQDQGQGFGTLFSEWDAWQTINWLDIDSLVSFVLYLLSDLCFIILYTLTTANTIYYR